MKRKAALALGIAVLAVIVFCLFSCGQEEKPQADGDGSQTASETDVSIEDESIEVDSGEDSESEKADSEKDSKQDSAKGSSKTSTSTNKKTGSSSSSSGKTSSKTSSSGKTSSGSNNGYGKGTPTPQNGSGNNGGGSQTDPTPAPTPTPTPTPAPTPAADPQNWPSNEYTALLPKPPVGTVQKTDMQDGVYCLLLTGADMSDVKAYASALINAGYINEVTETVESGTYLFGGGNSSGSFVVVSYQSGQFIIGVQP